MKATKIEFENSAKYITARDSEGKVIVRCNFDLTDCGYEETVEEFVSRRGGVELTVGYLLDCYRGGW